MDLVSLRARVDAGQAVVAGVLSGTSADGIDVALARPRARDGRLLALDVLVHDTVPFPVELAGRVRAVLDGAAVDLRGIALLHRDLGRAFGAAVRAVAEREGERVDLVGSHGQTVWHHDGRAEDGRATLQLGDGDWCSEAAGAPTVSDFRQRDVACGGEGAPLSACADDVVFAAAERPTCVLNLGGLANLTWLGRTPGELAAFDTGPANALLDGLARRLLGTPCDRDGDAARAGRVDAGALAELSGHPFFSTPPPKSTGRDTFGEAYVDRFLARVPGTAADRLATAVGLVAESVARGVRDHLPERPSTLWVAGGGVHNRAVVGALERALGCPVRSTAELGVDPDAREALVFAVLAVRWVVGEAAARAGATGAPVPRILGKLSPLGA